MVANSAPSYVQQTPYKSLVARTPDGVSIAVQDWGNPAGAEILFIHGFSQASLSWARQTSSELAREFHIVTYDLRGHGNSDKPLEREKYKKSKGWADDVKAVMETAKLKRPVLVGWSYGVHVIGRLSQDSRRRSPRGSQLRRRSDEIRPQLLW